MNKLGFAQKISHHFSLSLEECFDILHILDESFIFSSKGKEQARKRLKEIMKYSDEFSKEIMEYITQTIQGEMKKRIMHPFGRETK